MVNSKLMNGIATGAELVTRRSGAQKLQLAITAGIAAVILLMATVIALGWVKYFKERTAVVQSTPVDQESRN